MLAKREYIILSKTDVASEDEIARKVKALKKFKKEVITSTIATDDGIAEVRRILAEIEKEKTVSAEEKAKRD